MLQKLPDQIRTKIWNEKLTAEYNYYCYDTISSEFSHFDLSFKLALALTSSSTVVFWILIEPKEFLWKALSALSAIIAVIYTTLNFLGKIEAAIKMKSSYFQIWNDFEKLWMNIENQNYPRQKAIDEWYQIMTKEQELEKEKIIISINKRIKSKCYDMVLKNNNLQEVINAK
jgi:hypothetical protein